MFLIVSITTSDTLILGGFNPLSLGSYAEYRQAELSQRKRNPNVQICTNHTKLTWQHQSRSPFPEWHLLFLRRSHQPSWQHSAPTKWRNCTEQEQIACACIWAGNTRTGRREETRDTIWGHTRCGHIARADSFWGESMGSARSTST